MTQMIDAGVPVAAVAAVASKGGAPPSVPKHPSRQRAKKKKKPDVASSDTVPDSILVIALTDFQVQSMGDELNFMKGDVITIKGQENVTKFHNKKSRWVKGHLQGNEGVFPKKFTKLVTDPSRELRQRSPAGGQSKADVPHSTTTKVAQMPPAALIGQKVDRKKSTLGATTTNSRF